MKKALEILKQILTSGTVRRLCATALGIALVALDKKLDLNLTTEQIAGISGIVMAYLFQSAHTEATKIKAAAPTLAEAAAGIDAAAKAQ